MLSEQSNLRTGIKCCELQVDLLTEAWDELMILGVAFSTATNPNLPRYRILSSYGDSKSQNDPFELVE